MFILAPLNWDLHKYDMSEVEIRPAGIDDLPDIFKMVQELAVYEKAADQVLTSVEKYEEDFKQNWFEAILATEDDQIVGMALYYDTYSTWKGRMLWLEDFIVANSHRRKGIGQLLWDKLLDIGRSKGCHLMKWQVLDWNEPAIKFYEKHGATIEKDWWNGKLSLH